MTERRILCIACSREFSTPGSVRCTDCQTAWTNRQPKPKGKP
jgi:hypothetical protein